MSKEFARTCRRVAALVETIPPPDRVMFIAGLEFILASLRLRTAVKRMDAYATLTARTEEAKRPRRRKARRGR